MMLPLICNNVLIHLIFQMKKEYDNKLYELLAEIKNINIDITEVEQKTEQKNNLCQQYVLLRFETYLFFCLYVYYEIVLFKFHIF